MSQHRRKLIEVALPLDKINAESAREKSIRHGHPSTLHLWWARRPLAAARAVIFAQMVDDPSEYVDELLRNKGKKRAALRELKKRRIGTPVGALKELSDQQALADIVAELERERLFGILRELVKWENTTDETVLDQARAEIRRSWCRACTANADHPRAGEIFDRRRLPAFHDPFAGGGALPLEAQRLGLEAHASDLNPVAVLINKAMIEIPPKFAGQAPVRPDPRDETKIIKEGAWRGGQGLAEDVRYYGRWMRDEAERRIGHLYPSVEVTAAMVRERPDLKPYEDRNLRVIAWLWVRTVKSPNPAFADVDVPLASTFMLSTKKGREAYVEPVIEGHSYRFVVKVGAPADASTTRSGTSAGKRRAFRCLLSNVPLPYVHIRREGRSGCLGARLMAIVADGHGRRIYLSPSEDQAAIASQANPTWKPDCEMPQKHRNFQGPAYGLDNIGDLFTPRQLVALTTFSDLIGEAIELVRIDAGLAGMSDDGQPLHNGGTGATAYAEAVGLYLGFAISKIANLGSSITSWMSDRGAFRETFARQAIPMMWDFAEANPFAGAGGSLETALAKGTMVIDALPARFRSASTQQDAASHAISKSTIVSTDPPYYDNIGYADLSDFFYVWLRRALKRVFPELFSTLVVPKEQELVATRYRHGSKQAAEGFFLDGMTKALTNLAGQAHPGFPVTIYYAFKQSERRNDGGVSSTGWETFLDATIRAGFSITGTWPMRTESPGRIVARSANTLASSIVLVCRPRLTVAPIGTRREFLTALRSELPEALRLLQSGNIAPVDLAQAAIGPGMAIYTRYGKVLDAAGKSISVREALALINQLLDDVLAEQEGDFDADSRWALAWFEQHGFDEGDYGIAETLSKAKNTSVDGMVKAGILTSSGGTVRLLAPEQLPDGWDPAVDARLTAWESVHHLIRVIEKHGESGAATIITALGATAETTRELCYRLYSLCDRNRRTADARRYNMLIQSWSEITRLARSAPAEQKTLFDDVH